MQNLIKIYTKTHQNAHFFLNYFAGSMAPICVQLIALFLYENSHFLFGMLLKYTLNRINYNMISKNSSESYNQPHSSRVYI